MKNSKILFLSILSIFLFFTACDDDEPAKIDEAKVLVEYLGEYVNTDPFPAMIKATDVNNAVLTSNADMYIMDTRAVTDYNAGHIRGAVNVPFSDLLTHYEENSLESKETVVVLCYSGQGASYGTSLLRMLGYTNVKAMKWGMSSWNESTSSYWVNGIANAYAFQMETTAATKHEIGNLPEINTGESTGESILRSRVEELFTLGVSAGKISNETAFTNLDANYTVNYWSQEHYNVGHIPGAVQYTPKASFSYSQELTTLPTDKTIVVYCYTGQTSSFVTAYLKVLGYDAKSLVFGANGMMYDIMVNNGTMTVFNPETEVHDYPLVTE
jgi:rhodanese-related sulfurtransferase